MLNAILASSNPLEHVVPRNIIIGSRELPISNHQLMVAVAAVFLLIVLISAARQRTMVPSGLRNLIEMICVFIRNEIARPALAENTDKFIKYLWTIFFFILTCNLLGMIPTEGILYLISGGKLHNMGGTATGNIWVTGAMAGTVLLIMPIAGIRQQGFLPYLKNLIPAVPVFLWPMMYPLEIIGALVKPFALAIRLFANMLAGHAVLAAFLGLIFLSRSFTVGLVVVVAGAAMGLLELFVAFLQAYVFTFLTAMLIGTAIKPEH